MILSRKMKTKTQKINREKYYQIICIMRDCYLECNKDSYNARLRKKKKTPAFSKAFRQVIRSQMDMSTA